MSADDNGKTGITYADAGVDIDAGNALVERIKPAAKRTSRSGTMSGLGGFGALFDLKGAGYEDPILVAATDGVGIDLVAMCVNDLVCQGAEPLFFLDYFATGKLDTDSAARVIEGIAEGCVRSGCALIGGETAEMPGMYPAGDFDLAGFAVGAMERGSDLPKDVAAGDVLLGLASDGVHSNGYSLVRKLVEVSGLGWDADCPWSEGSLGEVLLTPTRLYVKQALAAVRAGGVHALAHITGGLSQQRLHQRKDAALGRVALVAHPQTKVGRHLVVARARGVQAARGLADDLFQPGLDVHVDVFERSGKREVTPFDL